MLFGFRIDADRNLIAIEGNVNDFDKVETLIVNLPAGATTLEVEIEPIVVLLS